jgi:hypothetical protein
VETEQPLYSTCLLISLARCLMFGIYFDCAHANAARACEAMGASSCGRSWARLLCWQGKARQGKARPAWQALTSNEPCTLSLLLLLCRARNSSFSPLTSLPFVRPALGLSRLSDHLVACRPPNTPHPHPPESDPSPCRLGYLPKAQRSGWLISMVLGYSSNVHTVRPV